MHSDAPTIAAIPLAWAMMQTWLVTLPRAVTTPAMRLKSISAVSDGVSSSATTIVPGASPANGFSAVSPVRIRRMRPHTSRTSSVRPPRYSSSSAASMPHTSSQASSKARSAEKPCSEIRSSTCSASIGSSAISKCAAKMSFSAANMPSSVFACASAAWKRAVSAAGSPVAADGAAETRRSRTNAVPAAIPAAGIPVRSTRITRSCLR